MVVILFSAQLLLQVAVVVKTVQVLLVMQVVQVVAVQQILQHLAVLVQLDKDLTVGATRKKLVLVAVVLAQTAVMVHQLDQVVTVV